MAWPGGSPGSVELALRAVDSSDTLETLSTPGTAVLEPPRRNNEDEATTSGLTDGAQGEAQNRVIFVNQPQPQKFLSNKVSTAKYSVPSFLPLFLFEQFRRYSNCFFLLIALLQQIPDVSPTGRWTTLTPLFFILFVSAVKEIVEDFKRHRADDETNNRRTEVLRDGRWFSLRWSELMVGDVVKILNNQFFPADLVLLATSEPQGISFIETSNLDGETNLKIRQAPQDTARLDSVSALSGFRATIQCESPNRHLYEFNGMLKEANAKSIPLTLEQMLLRGSMQRNTAWVHGVVIYTGHETKLMMNSTKAPLKRSSIDKQTNTQILMLFMILLVLSIVSAAFNELWLRRRANTDWYISLNEAQNTNFGYNFLTFLILYNNLIPISLQVTAEIVRFFQAKFIAMDCEMYHAATDTPAQARTSNLNEELGMVKYIFSDKTGTLTANVMEFHKCSIAEIMYNRPGPTESHTDTLLYQNLQRNHPTSPVIKEFLTMLAICHTVIPEERDGVINYHAASPDERALVLGAAQFGYVFTTRTPSTVTIAAGGASLTYQVLNVIEFTSARKRMSLLVRTPTGEIKLYCKGADSVIYPRLAGGPAHAKYAEATLAHLEAFACDGLRTLVFAVADIPEQVYQEWSNTYHKASLAIQNREQKIEEAAILIENNLRLLGATAIEDKLQDGVPETIAALLKANINVWVLTGDKQETAINIAHSAQLIHSNMPLVILNEDSLDGTREIISRHSADFGENLRKQNEVALIVDGKTLTYAMGCDLKKDFLDLCISCKVVVCCRVSPIQKAEVVEMVSAATGAVTLAIGDGANDVAMIQRASVGVGISGVEGLQAVCASDYSIAQFRFLLRLLLVHGAWNYSRISKLILYSFYKNICLYVIELWFAMYSAWSGQILFERWSIGFYNVIFTALPPFAIGLFDKLCSPEIMVRHPILYIPSQQGLLFNVRVFWVWVVNSLLHSVLLFWLPVLMTDHHIIWANGRDGGYLVLGNIVYTYVVLTVCLKAGLATHSWTWVTHVAIWGSLAMWFVFILAYSNVYPLVLIGSVMRGMDRMVFSSAVFWLGLVLIPIATLAPDLLVTVIHNSAFKSMTEAVRESEIKQRDPADLLAQPRHSLTETARLLQNVRSVFSRRSTTRVNLEIELSHERALVLGAAQFGYVFTTRTPSTVTIAAGGASLTYQVLNVIEFTSARKRMSLLVRTPTGEIKLYCKGADSVIYPRLAGGPAHAKYAEATLAHLEAFACDGLRTLVFAVADIPEQVYQEWSNTYHKASLAIQNREQKIEEAAILIENNLRLLGATAIEDKLQDGVPETIAALLKANINVWVLTGDKQETAINIAHSAQLIHSNMPLVILNEDSLDGTREIISRHSADFGENLRKQNEVALIVDGKTLTYAMGCDLKKDFLDLCISCKVVVCCRVSPIQKAEVVEMVSAATGAVTLAIGDGANDVAMIQRASVGVGISGVEGLQAVCASDYSIAQFRFLLRLLLVHGAWNYSRISKLILYSFYKNICLYVIELWFAMYSAWSGQILFERWSIGFYNVIFTALPPFAIGLFDKLCSPEIMVRHPILYIPSQQGLLFNVRVFWVWVVNSLLHSVLLFWLPVLMTDHHIIWANGRDGGYLVLGNIVYTYVVLTVCLKAGLATHSWTWVTHVAIWGSLAMWFVFILAYSNVYPLVLIGSVMRGMDRMVFSSAAFWLGLVLIPIATLAPDLLVTVIHNSAFKSMTEAVRESEIKQRDPADLLAQPRHSLTETARLLQNVRSVFSRRSTTRVNLEIELSHGFAFSQEEGGSVSQSDVIRAYDTRQPRPARS